MLQVAEAYLQLLRAEQESAIAGEIYDKSRRLAEITAAYAQTGQGLDADHDRAQTELALRGNDLQRASEQVQVASARLAQLIGADPLQRLEPEEPGMVPLELVDEELPAQELVAIGLSHRPEVEESHALVCEAAARLRRECAAPLLPSVLLGVSYGAMGGGLGGQLGHVADRFDADAVAYWEVRNLGQGDAASRDEMRSRVRQARWQQVATLDQVAREVVETRAQVQSRRRQIELAQTAIRAAEDSYAKNVDRIQNAEGLPLEVLQSLQALAQARREYLRAACDYNLAQFGLHHALGWPADVAPAE
jgi:outer membrane protein TolC